MASRLRLGLRGEILIAFALVTLFAIGLNTVVVWRLNQLLLRRERLDEARTAARLTVAALGDHQADAETAERIVRTVPGVMAVVFLDPSSAERARFGASFPIPSTDVNGALRLRETRAAEGEGRIIRVATPAAGGAMVLWMEVGSSREAVTRAMRIALAYVAMNAFIAGSFGWYLISRTVVRPVRRLVEATRRVAGGDLAARVPAGGNDELSDLARDFNRMTETLAGRLADLREANESLKAAREEVVRSEKLASVGRLAAGVAHELGNPVGAVTGYVSTMIRSLPAGDTSEDGEMLRRIDREMKRVDRIIRDLLDYARPREETRAPIDVDDVVDGALAVVGVQKAFKRISIERERGEGAKRSLGDPHRLQQVVVNLLINAADAVESASERRIVIETVRTEFPVIPHERRRREDGAAPAGPAVAVRVRDTGEGIAAEHLPLLFDPFFTTKEPGRGTGLGLAIARPIVEAMGGRLLVTSTRGHGSTFEVLLPLVSEPGTLPPGFTSGGRRG